MIRVAMITLVRCEMIAEKRSIRKRQIKTWLTK